MPRKHCTTRVRTRGKVRLNKDTRQVSMFAFEQQSEDWREWDSRTVSHRHAETEEAAGRAEAVWDVIDGVEQIVGWRQLQAYFPGAATPALLNERTLDAVSNAKNQRLCDLDRRDRQQVEKFIVWPLIGDTKAVCVRPRISDEDRRRAHKLLRTAA